MTGVTPPELADPPDEGYDWDYGPYLRAFDILNRSRKVEKTKGVLAGQPVTQTSMSNLSLESIIMYADRFPDDVDDVRKFIRFIQIIDEEFLNHGLRSS